MMNYPFNTKNRYIGFKQLEFPITLYNTRGGDCKFTLIIQLKWNGVLNSYPSKFALH